MTRQDDEKVKKRNLEDHPRHADRKKDESIEQALVRKERHNENQKAYLTRQDEIDSTLWRNNDREYRSRKGKSMNLNVAEKQAESRRTKSDTTGKMKV